MRFEKTLKDFDEFEADNKTVKCFFEDKTGTGCTFKTS